MPTAEDALLQYEGGQSPVAMAALTDSGDQTTFTSAATIWSGRSGYAPSVLPNGVLTGGEVTVADSGSNSVVDVAALTCNLNGVVTSVSAATDESITRPATNVAKVCSVTVNSGGSIAVVVGTDGGSTTFSETRGAAGGPPYIPTTSIELAQVRLTSSTAAVIASTEIFATDGLHRELAISPGYDINYGEGSVTFTDNLPAIHTGDVAKAVHASYATPSFVDIDRATDFVPPETTHSTSSTQIYRKTIASSSSTLGQGSFTAYLNDGVTDTLVSLKNELLWFRFYPDQYNSAYIEVQGKLGVSRSFPAGDLIASACTISAEEAGEDKSS